MATNMWLVGWIIDLEISQQEVDFCNEKSSAIQLKPILVQHIEIDWLCRWF